LSQDYFSEIKFQDKPVLDHLFPSSNLLTIPEIPKIDCKKELLRLNVEDVISVYQMSKNHESPKFMNEPHHESD
jgi:hypothetical protein